MFSELIRNNTYEYSFIIIDYFTFHRLIILMIILFFITAERKDSYRHLFFFLKSTDIKISYKLLKMKYNLDKTFKHI